MRHNNLCRCFLYFLMPLILVACSREPEFDRNFKKSCEATSNGNTGYCKCALGIVKRNIKDEALSTLSPRDIERLAPEIIRTCNAK